MTHIHGGNIYQYKEAADFSANINFHGMPQSVKEAAHAAIDRSIHYPEPDSQSLKAVLAEREGVPESAIICGNGAAELMFALAIAKRPKKAVLAQPCFLVMSSAHGGRLCARARAVEKGGRLSGRDGLQSRFRKTPTLILGNPEQSDRAIGSRRYWAGTCCVTGSAACS